MNAANGGQITGIRRHRPCRAWRPDLQRVRYNLDGRPAAGIGIFLLPNANANAVADEVKAKMDELAKSFPQGLRLNTL